MKHIPGKRQGRMLAFLTGVLLLSAGCAHTPPVRYYQLSALEATCNPATSEMARMVIGIGPVRLAEYLDRPQMVTRLTTNRLQLADSHRWAEPLGENISRVLEESLSALLGAERILRYPWPSSRTTDCQLLVEVLHFENESDGAARLVVRWAVKGRDGGIVLAERRSSYRVPAASQEQEGRVIALNEALRSFCREIAETLKTLPGKSSGSGL